jgi:hypothetical protein
MNCGKANKAGLVNYLYSPGLIPTINSDDCWHLFSFRNERKASFTKSTAVNRRANFNANHFSFQQQNNQPQDDVSNTKETPFHLQTISPNQQQQLTNFLLLNPLVFFQTSRLLLEKHDHVLLYLNHDNAGRSYVEQLQKRSIKYKGKSGLYKGYKDLND